MADGVAPAPSPFMAQYLSAKAEHPDALLFFRMGDFYELFFEDAEKAAAALNIALTRRGQHLGQPIPMAGVPWRQAEAYLAKLIRGGFKVAVCEQVEDPAEARRRGGKAIVKRAVTRIVTPGTLTEEALLEARAANRLAALAFAGAGEGGEASIAWADISTGEFTILSASPARLTEELGALAPAEVLAGEADAPRVAQACALVGAVLTPRPARKADPRGGERRAQTLFGVASLDAFGDFSQADLAAAALLLDYIELTQAGLAPRLAPPRRAVASAFMAIDPATRASLEIERSQRGTREGSLLGAIDRTLTAAGARMFAERLARPLLDIAAINARLDSCAFFLARPDQRAGVRAELKAAPDLARAAQRLSLGRGGPRDLLALREALRAGERAAARCGGADAPAEIARALSRLTLTPDVARLALDLAAALAPEPPFLVRDGGFIAPGYDGALDEARALRDDSRRVIAALQSAYQEETGLAGLKIRHNGVLGYHLDLSPKQAEALMRPPHSGRFIHRQTLAGAVRFTTPDLAALDARIARAGEEALAREAALFQEFCARLTALEAEIRAVGEGLAVLDVAAAAAEWAEDVDAVRPEIDDSRALIAEAARHPVVERAVRHAAAGFTPNDTRLDGDGQTAPRLVLVTGPNMAGKSTYLRQTALLAILAQAGFYVPAKRLRLGVVDRVFSRVGAGDDLARGRSTFMAEMVETAAILHQAGARALVILDEIGRGTATFDGLAIAWAAAEHMHDQNGARALFATHYHELTALADRLGACANVSLRAREWKGDLVFLHEVMPGPADRSYGIQVAKLAGLPRAVVERARAVLARLEAGRERSGGGGLQALPLFADQPPPPPPPSALEVALRQADPDRLTPKEALDLLYRLRALLPSG